MVSTYSYFPATLTPELTTFSLNGNDYLTDTNGNVLQEPAGYTFGPHTCPVKLGDRLALGCHY